GDLAVRERDTTTLARVMRLLASRVGDPLADRLQRLARADRCSPHEWWVIRSAITDRSASVRT
ncbi:MAG: hypothetical protein ABI591_25640, partial [Kofleriaceae bacterium]